APVRRDFFPASAWRVNSLSAQQQEVIEQLQAERYPRSAAKPSGRMYTPEEQQTLLLLAENPRVSASHVAGRIGCSVSTASKLLRRVVASNPRAFRVDVAHEAFGWNYIVSTLLSVPFPH